MAFPSCHFDFLELTGNWAFVHCVSCNIDAPAFLLLLISAECVFVPFSYFQPFHALIFYVYSWQQNIFGFHFSSLTICLLIGGVNPFIPNIFTYIFRFNLISSFLFVPSAYIPFSLFCCLLLVCLLYIISFSPPNSLVLLLFFFF